MIVISSQQFAQDTASMAAQEHGKANAMMGAV
jgi:hypothetical protein